MNVVILTKKDLKLLKHLIDEPQTILNVSEKVCLNYDNVRIQLRKLEIRGIVVSITNINGYQYSHQKLYKINPEVAKTIKELL